MLEPCYSIKWGLLWRMPPARWWRITPARRYKGRYPADVATAEIVKRVHDMILADRGKKVYEVAEAVGVPYGKAINILHDKLGMKKLFARSVPRLLTVHNKWIRLSTAKQWSQNVRVGSPHHRCLVLIASFSFNQTMAMGRGRSHELICERIKI